MGQWDDIASYLDAPAEAPDTAGPAARRARAGLPAEGGTVDPSPDREPQFARVQTIGGGRSPGRLPQAPPTSDPAQAGGIPDPAKFTTGAPRAQTELEGDPLAQGITASAMTAPIAGGALAGMGRAAGPIGRTAATIPVGAAEGAAAAKLTGGDAKAGAAAGTMFALGPALAGIGHAMKARGAMADAGIAQDLAPHMTPDELAQLRRGGYAKMAETARKYGVVGAPDPVTANRSVTSGRAAVEGEISDVFSTVGTDYARPATNLTANANREAQAMRGTVAGNKAADALMADAKKIFEANNGGPVTLANLRRELSDAIKAKNMPLAGQLRTELNAGLQTAMKDPKYTSMIERLPELSATHRALSTLEETTARAADRAMGMRPPTLRERARSMLPGGSLPDEVGTVAMPTGNRLSTVGLSHPVAPPVKVQALEQFPGLAAGLDARDKSAIDAELRRELFK